MPVSLGARLRKGARTRPRSQVVRQAGNRLHVQKALLQMILGDA